MLSHIWQIQTKSRLKYNFKNWMLLRPDMKHNEEVGEGERRVVVEAAAEKGELFVEFPRKHTKQNSLNVLTQLQIK